MPRTTSKHPRAVVGQLAELSMAVPQVVAHRLARMALAGPVLSPRDSKEFSGMVLEKQLAFTQAWRNMALEAWRVQAGLASSWFKVGSVVSPQSLANYSLQVQRSWENGAMAVASKGLAPVHRKATANAKRLAKSRLV